MKTTKKKRGKLGKISCGRRMTPSLLEKLNIFLDEMGHFFSCLAFMLECSSITFLSDVPPKIYDHTIKM
jgi:hypothetical protein